MSRLTLHFDTLDYVEKAEKLGIPSDVAKFHAREMEYLYTATIDEVKKEIKNEFNNKEFATKHDIQQAKLELQKEIASLRYDTLKFIIWTGCGVSTVILGGVYSLLKTMLH
ncbi:MAG: hypothetical protein QG673_1385 [Pseudomonadota bacterium]|nr:hypothetical protein [Pseudomonadota bacterium]